MMEPKISRPQNEAKVLLTLQIESNTFSFYRELTTTTSKVIIDIFTDFSNTDLAEDFPDGSHGGMSITTPLSFTDEEAIDFAGARCLENWMTVKINNKIETV